MKRITLFLSVLMMGLALSQSVRAESFEIALGKAIRTHGLEETKILLATYSPDYLHKLDLRMHGGFILQEKSKTVKFAGVDYYWNGFVEQKEKSPFSQVGVGLSYFDRLTENLGSRLEIHLFLTLTGVIRNDGRYMAFRVDHFSNGGATEKNTGENFLTFVFGF